MNQVIFISVIIPVYNGEKYIREAIDSILQQTYPFMELILINDASTDQTDTIIQSYSDERIVYLVNSGRQGTYKCRNRAVQMAKGQYLAMMDADDIAMPERLEKQFRYLEAHPDVCAVGADRISIPMNSYDAVPHSYEEILLALLKDNAFVHSSLMVRASVFRQLGGYEERYLYSSDYDLACRLALTGKVVNLSEALVFYRWHSEQISQRCRKEQAEYAGEIRGRYQKDFIDFFRRDGQKSVEWPDIAYPDMGVVIAYYTYGVYSENSKYSQIAEQKLDRIVSSLSLDMPIRLKDGILGIACGVVYLLRNGFIEGDEDEILAEVDELFFQNLICLADESVIDWYGWFYYSRLRLSYKTLEERGLQGAIFQQNFIYLLDCLVRSMRKGTCLDERMRSEVEWFHAHKICPVTTEKILAFRKSEDQSDPAVPIASASVSFLIPLRVDSEERVRNLDLLLAELTQIENATIWILEADRTSSYKLKVPASNIHYTFVEDRDPVFHRTKYLNRLLREADSDIVGIWDTDVVIRKTQISEAVEAVKMGRAAMSFPYDGRFYMLSPDMSNVYCSERSFDELEKNFEQHYLVHGPYSVGGAFLVNRKLYLQSGGENEHFYGWGPEDAERVKRMEILGLPVYRSNGPLFHLYHPRGKNSWYQNKEIEKRNRLEFLKVCGMTREELQEYVRTWKIQTAFRNDDISNGSMPDERRKIFFCIDSLGCGGAERLLIDILRRLDYNRFDVSLLVLSDIGEYIADIPEQVKWCTSSSVGRFEELLNDRYDVEVAFLEGLAVKYIAGRDSGAVKIAWIHTNMERFNWPRRFYNTDEEECGCYAKMDKLVFVSNDSLNGFKTLFSSVDNEKIVIHNLIDTSVIVEKSLKKTISKTKFTICCIGRLSEVKGHELLLSAVSRLLEEKFDFQVWIFGEGELREVLEKQIRRLGISKNVVLNGFVKNPYPYLAQADLFVSSSLVEGACLAICEALSLEIPVLATRSGGADEMLKQGEYGMLVPVEEKSIYKGIKSLLENRALYKKLRRKAWLGKKCFDANRTMGMITTLLQNV